MSLVFLVDSSPFSPSFFGIGLANIVSGRTLRRHDKDDRDDRDDRDGALSFFFPCWL